MWLLENFYIHTWLVFCSCWIALYFGKILAASPYSQAEWMCGNSMPASYKIQWFQYSMDLRC